MYYGADSNLIFQRAKSVKMEDEENNTTGKASSRLLPNNTTARSVERTSTQNVLIPILEMNDHTSAKLWWRKFVQYTKQTLEIDLSNMTNSGKDFHNTEMNK